MTHCKFYTILFFFIISVFFSSAQEMEVARYKEIYQVHIRKTHEKIVIDGDLQETAWKEAALVQDFWMKFPRDDIKAYQKTEVRVTYDNHFLYIGALVYDSMPLISLTLKRDARIRENDGFGVVLDPMNKKINGFYFSVTAYNVQADDLITAGNERELNFSWDNKWYSKTKIFPDRYQVEMAIPFKTLRYDKHATQWGINFIRSNRKRNEFHTWTRIPVQFPGIDMGYLGALQWDAPPPQPGTNISVIPYLTATMKESRIRQEPLHSDVDAGFDSKISLTSSLNLDLTLHPDFSQVEVDRQITNIGRFSIFFPERRNFFLENNDLFAQYGIPGIRPFYSRRIGLDPDGNTIPILFGARITGSISPRTRVGLMDMQTRATSNYARQNYAAFSIQQQLLHRSTVKAYFFNRQEINDEKHPSKGPLEEYGRNTGTELLFVNNRGDIQGWLGWHQAWKKGISKDKSYFNPGLGYFGRKVTSFLNIDVVGTNYYTDMGFVRRIENYDALKDTIIRLGFTTFYNENQFMLYPKKGKLNQIELNLNNTLVLNPDNSFNEGSVSSGVDFDFKNTRSLDVGIDFNRTRLLFPTSFTDATPLPLSTYSYFQLWIRANTDSRKNITATVSSRVGGYFNGRLFQLSGGITLRRQPTLTLELNAEYNKLLFPDPYGKENLLLVSSRLEINFSNKLFWTTFLQYNTQRNNININSRLQWRYQPVSDIYLVYTDNYFSDPFFKSKSRALALKINYWLNI